MTKSYLEGITTNQKARFNNELNIDVIYDNLRIEFIRTLVGSSKEYWYVTLVPYMLRRFYFPDNEIKTKEFHDEIRRLSKWFEEEYPELILVWGKNNVN